MDNTYEENATPVWAVIRRLCGRHEIRGEYDDCVGGNTSYVWSRRERFVGEESRMEITKNIKLAQSIIRTCRTHEYHVYRDSDACVGGDTLYVWTTREYVRQDEESRG